jgi:dipeptidyl aminopeptidase/acylaminoacyl peptidase
VTDLKYQLTSLDGDIPRSEQAVQIWKSILGTTDFSAPMVREISPVHFADKLKGKPIFLYAGLDDIRVPIAQINEMASNLEAAGNPPKAFVVKRDEGHGFGKLENNVDLYTQILEFLKNHL